MKYAMLIDLRRCFGCRACMVACAQENSVLFDYRAEDAGVWLTKWAVGELDNYNVRILEVNRNGVVKYVSLSCMHCENPPCVAVCPTGASYKDVNGIVKVDYNRCVGCKACMAACPYGARYIRKTPKSYPSAAPPGVADKCNFCYHLVEKGGVPRCVVACHARARIFGDLDDPNSAINQALRTIDPRSIKTLREDLNTKPKVLYVGL